MNVLLEMKIKKALRGLKKVKNKLKEAKHFAICVYAVVFRKGRVREIVDQVASAHLRILGRYPDDKRRYIKGILTGTVSANQMEKELMGTAEYEEKDLPFLSDIRTHPRRYPAGCHARAFPGGCGL